MKIVLDLDGVLVDFAAGAAKAHGLSVEEVERRCPIGKWDMAEGLGISIDEFWKPIHAIGEQFWIDLPVYPWFGRLLYVVKSIDPDFRICTAPSQQESSRIGKRKWATAIFGASFAERSLVFADGNKADVIFGKHPGYVAPESYRRQHVLIDDRPENVAAWRARDSEAILFPSRYNSRFGASVDLVFHELHELEREING